MGVLHAHGIWRGGIDIQEPGFTLPGFIQRMIPVRGHMNVTLLKQCLLGRCHAVVTGNKPVAQRLKFFRQLVIGRLRDVIKTYTFALN